MTEAATAPPIAATWKHEGRTLGDGTDGKLKADTAYRLDAAGRFVEAAA